MERALHSILVCRLVTGLRQAARVGTAQASTGWSMTTLDAGIEFIPLSERERKEAVESDPRTLT